MRRMISVTLLMCCMFILVACSDNNTASNVKPESSVVNDSNEDSNQAGSLDYSSLEVLETIWESYDESELFPCMGGDFINPTDSKPGSYNLDEMDNLIGTFYVPEGYKDIEEAATLIHMMNANTFTGVAVKVLDVNEFSELVKDNILNTQWVCGVPDRLYCFSLGDVVCYAFGEATIMDYFVKQVNLCFPEANILFDEALVPEF